MTFSFDVNNKRVEYKFDSFLGTIKISVDGEDVFGSFIITGGQKMATIQIDDKEVGILMDQPMFLALLRKKTFKVYIDKKLFRVFDKKGRLIQTEDIPA